MKIKILTLVLFCLFLFSCGPKFNDTKATEVIKKSFELTEKDELEILGFSAESKDVALVKFKLNGVQISSKMRRYDKGWQLDEIQNDLGMWVPAKNITGLFSQQEKLKIVIKDITIISTALADYVTDNGYAPKQEGICDENSEFFKSLSPSYLKSLPIKDPWGNNYLVYCGMACNEKYGISGCSLDDFLVVSYGLDGQKESWLFDTSDPEAGLFHIYSPNDYNKDLVMFDGSWIRCLRAEE